MNSKSLMIGDWVYLKYITGYRPYKVTLQGFECSDYWSLEPIPLTPEIIEKNGFRGRPDLIGHPMWISENQQILISQLTNWKKWNVHIDNEDCDSLCNVECDYVHEFQHILRLCGLDNFADNLKV